MFLDLITPVDANSAMDALSKCWKLKGKDSRELRAKKALGKLVTGDIGQNSDVLLLAAALADEWEDQDVICVRLSDISRLTDSVETAASALSLLSFADCGDGHWSNADTINKDARRYPVSVDPHVLVDWLDVLSDFALHAANRAGGNANA